MDVLFYTSVHILRLVKLILGCCTVVNDLECEIIGRDGGGGIRFVVEVDCKVILPSELVNSVAVRFLFPRMDFRGTTND
jgi:hypothetical protein